MVSKYNRGLYADHFDKTRDSFIVSDTNSNLTVRDFDNVPGSNNLHDQINLTAIFDAIGGTYDDGSNDLQDRIGALKLTTGDYDGDGKADDVQLTINDVANFKIDFIDPANASVSQFNIGSGTNALDDIAVMNTPSATISSDGSLVKAGGATLYDSALNSFSITSDGHVKINGVVDPYTHGVTQLVVENGAVFQSAPDPSHSGKTAGWWQYTQGSGYHNWTETSNPIGDTLTHAPGATPVTTPTPATPVTTPVPIPTPSSPGSGGSVQYLGEYPANWARLSNGVNVERSEFGNVSDADMKYLHDIGVQNFRVFLDPDEYLKAGQSMNPDSNYAIKGLKSFMDRAIDAGIAVVVSPFATDNPAFLKNPNDTTSINQYVSWSKEFAGWIDKNYDPKDVFIETKNEPVVTTSASDLQDDLSWWKIQGKMIDAIRSAAPDFTIMATANMWSSTTELTKMTAYADHNVVYDIHYYQPMSFTHQGASWVSWAASLVNQQWPGSEGKTLASVQSDLAKVKAWADAQDAFIHVGEFGVMKTAPADDRAQWMTDMRTIFDKYGWGWDAWDYNKAFGITTTDSSGHESVTPAMLKALDWGSYSKVASPWDALDGSTSSISPAKTASVTSPTTTGTSTFTADSSFLKGEKFTLTADQLTKTVVINNFDSVNGTTGVKDQVNLDAIFDAIGGKFTDGNNDFVDRKAALHLSMLDLNGDGKPDMQLTIDGASHFHLNFISPNDAHTNLFEIGTGSGAYDNILIG